MHVDEHTQGLVYIQVLEIKHSSFAHEMTLRETSIIYVHFWTRKV